MTRLVFASAVAVVMAVRCDAIDLSRENWKVPNWTTIVTEHGAIQEQYGKTKKWCGHVQFVEVKDGQVYDFTWHGAGFRKEIER